MDVRGDQAAGQVARNELELDGPSRLVDDVRDEQLIRRVRRGRAHRDLFVLGQDGEKGLAGAGSASAAAASLMAAAPSARTTSFFMCPPPCWPTGPAWSGQAPCLALGVGRPGSRLAWSSPKLQGQQVEVLQRCRSGHRKAQVDVGGAAGEVALRGLGLRRRRNRFMANRGIVDPPRADRPVCCDRRPETTGSSAFRAAPSIVQTAELSQPARPSGAATTFAATS